MLSSVFFEKKSHLGIFFQNFSIRQSKIAYMSGQLFVENLQLALKEKKLAQKDLAKTLQTGTSTISNWIKRGTIPAADTAVKIAQLLGVSVEWLVTGRDAVSETFSREEVELVRKWRAIKDDDRQTLTLLLDTFYGKTQAALEKKEA